MSCSTGAASSWSTRIVVADISHHAKRRGPPDARGGGGASGPAGSFIKSIRRHSDKYFVLQVAPGKHTYEVHSEAADRLTIDADAGETYYIEGEIGVGILVGHPHIKPSEKSAFEEVRGKLTEVPPIAK